MRNVTSDPKLIEERDRLRDALLEAADQVEYLAEYAGDYLAEKWGIAEEVAGWRELCKGEEGGRP